MFALLLLALFFIAAVVLPALFFIPAVRKAGFSGWWVLTLCLPVVGVLFLWAFAYSPWPAHPDR